MVELYVSLPPSSAAYELQTHSNLKTKILKVNTRIIINHNKIHHDTDHNFRFLFLVLYVCVCVWGGLHVCMCVCVCVLVWFGVA